MDPQMLRKKKRMRSVRDQHLLLPDLLLAYFRTNMMRLWESLRWSPGERKGLRREVIQTFRMLKKLPSEKLTLVTRLTQRHLGLGKFFGGLGSATLRECVERALQQGVVAPATLHSGEVQRNQPTRHTSSFHPLQHWGGALLLRCWLNLHLGIWQNRTSSNLVLQLQAGIKHLHWHSLG